MKRLVMCVAVVMLVGCGGAEQDSTSEALAAPCAHGAEACSGDTRLACVTVGAGTQWVAVVDCRTEGVRPAGLVPTCAVCPDQTHTACWPAALLPAVCGTPSPAP